jgi:CRISPR-associated protein (TIGR02584 family)
LLFLPGGDVQDVLIALCGLTPQVVTETLWALRHQDPPVVPERLLIVTTESGKQACAQLLLGRRGKLASYLREYPQRGRPLVVDRIVTLAGADGRPVEDLRTRADNSAIADQLAATIRGLTRRPNVRLHCSVAGGRKTMGVLLAAVLQIYGRPEDRLYHVLVTPDFESHPDFFYIPKRPRLLARHGGRRLDTRDARIELAEIPYVRLRAFLSANLLGQELSFSELVARAQHELRALEGAEPVNVQPAGRRLLIGGASVTLTPAQARLYAAFARIKAEHCVERGRKVCGECVACYVPVSKSSWDAAHHWLKELAGGPLLAPRGERGESVELGVGRFRSLVSKTNRALEAGLGSERLAARYRIRSVGERGETRYGLAVDKTLIRLGGPEAGS